MAKATKVDKTLETDEQKRIRRLKESIRDANKEIKQLKEVNKLKASVEKWKDITDVKNKVLGVIKQNESTKGFSLKKLMNMQEYYIYQNPKNTKQKGSDESADWVKKFTSSGGDIATLIDTANKSRPTAWKKLMGRKKTTSKKSSTTSKTFQRKLG